MVVLLSVSFAEADDTLYNSGKREAEVKGPSPSTPDRFDVFDTHGNRLGYGQRSPYNGDIDLYDTHGRRSPTVVRPSKGGGGRRGR